jgi:foldase protein PrsA
MSRVARTVAWLAVCCAGTTMLGGCGAGSAGSARAVQVGDMTISGVSAAHWMTVLAPQHQVPDPPAYAACIAARRRGGQRGSTTALASYCANLHRTLERSALDYLITSDWLVGEAAQEGVPVSTGEVGRRLRERERGFSGSSTEFAATLSAIGHTRADVKLEITRELAAKHISRRLSQLEARISSSQVAQYYRQHVAQFSHPEERHFYIVENIIGKQTARALRHEFASRKRSIAGDSEHEALLRPASMQPQRTIVKAIFKVKPNVVSEPVPVGNYFFLVQVWKVTPAYVQSLAQAQAEIARMLASEQRDRTIARFLRSWRSRWTARTNCSPGDVVPGCRQYHGVPVQEQPPALP